MLPHEDGPPLLVLLIHAGLGEVVGAEFRAQVMQQEPRVGVHVLEPVDVHVNTVVG